MDKIDFGFPIWICVIFIWMAQFSQCSDMSEMKKSLRQIEVNTRAKQ